MTLHRPGQDHQRPLVSVISRYEEDCDCLPPAPPRDPRDGMSLLHADTSEQDSGEPVAELWASEPFPHPCDPDGVPDRAFLLTSPAGAAVWWVDEADALDRLSDDADRPDGASAAALHRVLTNLDTWRYPRRSPDAPEEEVLWSWLFTWGLFGVPGRVVLALSASVDLEDYAAWAEIAPVEDIPGWARNFEAPDLAVPYLQAGFTSSWRAHDWSYRSHIAPSVAARLEGLGVPVEAALKALAEFDDLLGDEVMIVPGVRRSVEQRDAVAALQEQALVILASVPGLSPARALLLAAAGLSAAEVLAAYEEPGGPGWDQVRMLAGLRATVPLPGVLQAA